MIGRHRPACLAIILGALLAGCTTYPRMNASWYIVYKPVEAKAGQAAATSEIVDGIYVALTNRDRRPASIFGIRINSKTGALIYPVSGILFPASGSLTETQSLQSGKMLLMKTELFVTCQIPFSLWIMTDERRGWHRVPVRGAAPATLPEEWLHGRDCFVLKRDTEPRLDRD